MFFLNTGDRKRIFVPLKIEYMKKYFVFSLFIFTSTLFGQNFKAGLIGGIAASQITNDGYKGYNKMGFIFGVFVNRVITENVKWQLEIRYIGKGAAEKLSSNDPFRTNSLGNPIGTYVPYKINLNYIEIPVLLDIKVSAKTDFELGPAIGFLVRQTMIDFYGNGKITPNEPFNKTEFSGLIGFGYHITPKLKINFKFQYSLYPVGGIVSNSPTYLTKGFFNNTLALAVYYNFVEK